MSEQLRDSLWRITEKLVSLAAADEQVRHDLHALARAVVLLTMPQPPALPTDAPAAVEAAPVTVLPIREAAAPPVAPQAPAPASQVAELAHALTFTQPKPAEPPASKAAAPARVHGPISPQRGFQ